MAKATIFIADDECVLAELLAYFLRDEGFAVETFEDGRTLLSVAESAHPPDLVVSDVMMLGLDGYALADALRVRGIPVILMSAAARTSECDGIPFVRKPFDLDDILAEVGHALAADFPARSGPPVTNSSLFASDYSNL
jgi:DNA-binding response OmpR family regulator